MFVTGARLLAPILAVWCLAVNAQGTASVHVDGEPLTRAFTESSLIIETSADTSERFAVFLAEEPAQWARGLMLVREMPERVGMLFLYPRERMISMCMKNTLIPLDMVFIDNTGTVVRVAENTTPGSLATISSQRPARAVLEINAGLARRLGIDPGDRVRHPVFD